MCSVLLHAWLCRYAATRLRCYAATLLRSYVLVPLGNDRGQLVALVPDVDVNIWGTHYVFVTTENEPGIFMSIIKTNVILKPVPLAVSLNFIILLVTTLILKPINV